MKFPIILFTSLCACVLASAQVPEGYVQVDSLVYVPLAAVDTSLNHKYIGSVLPEDVNLIQSAETETALRQHILSNESKTVGCYRIRIFFDNKQNSRGSPRRRCAVSAPFIPGFRHTGHSRIRSSKLRSGITAASPRPFPQWRLSDANSPLRSSSGSRCASLRSGTRRAGGSIP